MIMVDSQIKDALASGVLVIEPFDEASLQPASYDMRFGKKVIVTGVDEEIDLERKRSLTIKAGDFALLTTLESIKLPNNMAGNIGVKSYYTRKGMIVLAGLQIDPGFEGVLVVGIYNASPRGLTIDYEGPFCTIELHQLSVAATKPFMPGEEQKRGEIPRVDKDYLRTLEVESLTEMSQSMRELTRSVGDLTSTVRIVSSRLNILSGVIYALVIPLLVSIVVKLMFFPSFPLKSPP